MRRWIGGIICCVPLVVFGSEVSSKRPNTSPTSAARVESAEESVSLESGSAPRKDTDLVGLYAAMKGARVGQKSEYETQGEYAARIKAFRFRRVGVESYVFYSIPISQEQECSTSYSADKEELAIDCAFSAAIVRDDAEEIGSSESDNNRIKFLVDGKTRKIRTYVGVNAYNRKQVIEESSTVRWFLGSSVGYIQESIPLRTTISIARGNAAAVRSRLRLGVVALLTAPYTLTVDWRKEPTITSPVDKHYSDRYISGAIQELWIYNGDSKEINKRLVLRGPQNRQRFKEE